MQHQNLILAWPQWALPLLAAFYLLPLSGCTTQGAQVLQQAMAPLGMASSVAVDHDSRWRLPAASAVTVVAVNVAPSDRWLPATISGLQSQFPRTRAAVTGGEGVGLTVYVQWPAPKPATATGPQGPLAGLPRRAWEILSHTPSARITVICVDNQSRAIVHRAALRIHSSWLTAPAERAQQIHAAFAGYARTLAAS